MAGTSDQYKRMLLLSLMNKMADLEAEFCVPGLVKERLKAVFVLGRKISREAFSAQEVEMVSSFLEQSTKAIHGLTTLEREEESLAETIIQLQEEDLFVQSLTKINDAVEAKDPYTRGHADRVAKFSVIVGTKLTEELAKVPRGERCLYYAGLLHDVGKIKIPDSILKKESSLDDEEYNKMKMHSLESAKIIEPMERWFGKVITDAVRYHHEDYDGGGYPYGKKKEETNILARIIRVSDSFDAMITDRPYRHALAHEIALSELQKNRGKQFDPKVVDVFLEAYQEGLFKQIFLEQLKGKETK